MGQRTNIEEHTNSHDLAFGNGCLDMTLKT